MNTFFNIAGGVALFLYGIRLMSEALQLLAGEKMRELIANLTKTPLRGIFVGMLVTVLIQSSTGTTVMTVSFVNAGLLNLKQAIGIIMGANIGTTITAQIIAFKIEAVALPLIALGMVLTISAKSKQLQYLANGIIGLGMLFMGMQIIGNSSHLISEHKNLLLILSRNPLTGVIAGMILTILIQSSAATIGLTMAVASQGLIDLDAAIPIILGDNLGTTLTAVVVAMGSTRPAKQAAAAHVLFNLIGTVIFLLFFPLYKNIVIASSSDLGRQIANAHTIFNILNTIIFFPFVSLLAKLISTIIPLKPEDRPEGALYLNRRLISVSVASAVEAVRDEISHMGSIIQAMLEIVHESFFDHSGENKNAEDLFKRFENLEHGINSITREISSYASEIWQKGVSEGMSNILGCYVNTSLDIERIGDHAENLIERSSVVDSSLSDEARSELKDMFETAAKAVSSSIASVQTLNINQAQLVTKELETKIDNQEKFYRHKHIERLNRGECDPERGVNFITLLGDLERIGDHANNIAGYTMDIVKQGN